MRANCRNVLAVVPRLWVIALVCLDGDTPVVDADQFHLESELGERPRRAGRRTASTAEKIGDEYFPSHYRATTF